MESQNKLTQRPIFQRDSNQDPFPKWMQPSQIFSHEFGLQPFLEPGDLDWLEWAKRRLDSVPWLAKGPLLSPFSGQHLALNHIDLKQLTGGSSEVRTGDKSWRVELDVKHFSPGEITVALKEGYLQISGKHDERQAEQGSVSRCFTRKYKVPRGLDLQLISSSLSPDGLLSVEAPAAAPGSTGEDVTELVIPVQTEQIRDKQ